MAKVTLSVPDDLYARIETHKEELNLSEIFRIYVSEEIEKLEGKARIITELKDYVLAKSPFEAERKTEINRFTQKWGDPNIVEPIEFAYPYVKLMKNQLVAIGNTTLASKIFNKIAFSFVSMVDPEKLVEFNPEKWSDIGQGRLGHIMDFFKFNGFNVGELFNGHAGGPNWGLTPHMLAELLPDDEMKIAEAFQREFKFFGLFAVDKEDVVFIAYRKEKHTQHF